MRTFRNMDSDIRDQLKILWTTDGYTPHAIAANAKLSPEINARVQSALVAMEQTEEGRRLLESIKIKGFEAARSEDWDDVRALNIHLLQSGEEQ